MLIAQLHFSKAISKKENPTNEELDTAKLYLKNYAKKAYKTIQWYQISALVEDKLKNYKKAYKKIKIAYKLAKVYGWDLTELKQQKNTIKEHKNS